MTNDDNTGAAVALVDSPFGPRDVATRESAGALQNQSRELAETQTKYLMAQRFPRDVVANMDKILNAFTRPTLAEKAQYQFARGGTDIVGPSIRAAEAIAQQWGNMEQGFREIQRGVDAKGIPYSEVEAYCVDLESRASKRLQFIVPHWRDTKQGGYKLKDERDIYELIANQAQRRTRACILAMVPGDVVEAAMSQAEVTLKAKADITPDGIQKLLATFEELGVSKELIEKRIQRRAEAIQPAQVVSLKRIYASLRDGMSDPQDWFDMPHDAPAAQGLEVVRAAAAAKRSAKSAPKTGVEPPADPPSPPADQPEQTPAKPPRQAKPKAAPSIDDAIARINACNDADVLDVLMDEFRGIEDDAVADAYRTRRAALSGNLI